MSVPSLDVWIEKSEDLTVTLNGVTFPKSVGASIKVIRWSWLGWVVKTGWFPQIFTLPRPGTYVLTVTSIQSDGLETSKKLDVIVPAVKVVTPYVTVVRGELSFVANNESEKILLEDFLGIKPSGDDLYTHVGKLSYTDLGSWRDYWVKRFSDVGRSDLVNFAEAVYDTYAEIKIPPYEYKVIPSPPLELKKENYDLWQELDTALYNKDPTVVLSVLRKMLVRENSPIVVLGVVLSIPFIVGLITGVIGSYSFAQFMMEETLQTIDFAVYSASSNKEWDLMKKALDKKNEILEINWLEGIQSAIPFWNVIAATNKYFEASKVKYDIDLELWKRKQVASEINNNVSLTKAADAIKAGQNPSQYLPTSTITPTGVTPPTAVTPTPTKAAFKIYISSSPTNAKLYIDGVYTHHYTPSGERELSDVMSLLTPGEHTITVIKGGKKAEQKVTIVDGDNGSIFLKLETVGLVPAEEVIVVPLGIDAKILFDRMLKLTSGALKITRKEVKVLMKEFGVS